MNPVQFRIIVAKPCIRHAKHYSTVDVDQHEQTPDMKQPRFSLSQETITILTVGAALAGIILVGLGEMRVERQAMREDARADRARIEASMNQMRAEGQASREAFEKQITRLVEQQGTLNGLMDGLRNPIASQGE